MGLVLRSYEDDDEPGVLALLAASLGKVADERYAAFFRWKHLENPFGRSYMWVATSRGVIVGFRAFMRWRFTDGGGHELEAVRAVDTATDPGHRGGGIFRNLTMLGVEGLEAAGTHFIFNTPNDQSRPGYLKMGWSEIGRVPVRVAPRSPSEAGRLLGARGAAASPWSSETLVGDTPELDDDAADGVRRAQPDGLRTAWTGSSLRWRLGGFAPTSYRLLSTSQWGGVGWVAVRFRERRDALECTVGLATARGHAAARAIKQAVRQQRATYALGVRGNVDLGRVALAVPLGPVLVARPVRLDRVPPLDEWALCMADVELF